MKRIMVNLTDEQYKIINKFRGKLGNRDAEILKAIILAYLSEKTYLKESMG